ncbi:hypothetical protein [Streptantibioticus silvisoli]|uniref:Uncharacterized protein n=1 Tax=Streptantibioticus silvisoli TaxID=2705255 RepID=A0ABT6W6T9_9ACTN|nr:hypothetical protein [Streptantibioticus silvisoli]MDI5966399.1 hypothetical protein [Streptantibioticus silvisoli]
MEQHVSATTTGLTADVLMSAPGQVMLPRHAEGRPEQLVSWTPVVVDAGTRALRMMIEHELPPGGRFSCRLTASEAAGSTGFRVSMGRQSDGSLAPARVEQLFPPRSLSAILRDPALRCTDGNDIVTALAAPAHAAHVEAVRRLLAAPDRRLPVLVVCSPRTMGPAARFARKAAHRLAGLAHVVLMSSWLALDSFNAAHEAADALVLPRDGARLYWPGTAGRSPWWGPAEVAGDHEALMRQLGRLLAPLSVVARGRDRLWDAVRAAEAVARADALVKRASGNDSAHLAVLRERLEEERALQVELLELNIELEAKIARLEIDKVNLEAQLHAALAGGGVEPAVSPEPPIAEPHDFSTAWDAWTRDSEGALVFTANAKEEWQRSSYPYPERMREALDTLAELAGEWRRRDGELGTSLVSWIGDQTPLDYANSDEPLRRKGLSHFTFENAKWDRQPHIKLDDHTTPDRVGRIYFAIDKTAHRWIVDHVGVKLYRTKSASK